MVSTEEKRWADMKKIELKREAFWKKVWKKNCKNIWKEIARRNFRKDVEKSTGLVEGES